MTITNRLRVMNYAVSFQDHDDTAYMEYSQLKCYLSRRERMLLVKALLRPKYNERGALNWYVSNMGNVKILQYDSSVCFASR